MTEKTKLIPVRMVSETRKSALVEWLDKKGLHRASLPIEAVVDGKVDAEILAAAPQFGVPWADMPIKAPSGDELQAALYAAGVWTEYDVRTKAPMIIGVLQALYGVHLGSLVEYAAKYIPFEEVK